jgi:CDGSH-type Zn-finger protein
LATNSERDTNDIRKIIVKKDGPYVVIGGIPLVRKVQIVSEYGEPIAWKKEEVIETSGIYRLCRCGCSNNKPFCDDTHEMFGFDGAESAPESLTVERRVTFPGGKQIIVRRDYSICMDAGFCGNRFTNIEKMVADSEDTRIRAQIIGMIERCPSGSYTYSLEGAEGDIEPDLPQQIAVTMEMTSDGPIVGPLWVTGNIPIERADGKPFEVRNRVTLCRCGESKLKPLCDGLHRQMNIKE